MDQGSSSGNAFPPSPEAVVVPKHNLGSYYDNLPRLSSRERIQKHATNRFCTSESRTLLRKFSEEKQVVRVKQEVQEEVKAETVLRGLRAGMTGSNNPGGLWKAMEDGPEGSTEGKIRKWAKIYEERVAKIYEKHRCRVGGGGIGPAANKNFSVEDFELAKLDNADATDMERAERSVFMMKSHHVSLDGKEINGGAYVPKFTAPQKLPFGSRRNKFCEECGLNCSVEQKLNILSADEGQSPDVDNATLRDGNVGCLYCSVVFHLRCLPKSSYVNPSKFVCPDCIDEINFSKSHYEKEKLAIYHAHLETHYATIIVAMWRSRVAKSRYITMKRFLVRLQAMARAFKLRHNFKQMRRMQPRPLRIHLKDGRDLPVADWDNQLSDPFVILTILDEKDRQIWKFESEPCIDTLNPVFDEDFVIPGCPGTSKVVITVVDKDDLRDQFLGQAFLPLNPRPTLEVWKVGGTFSLALDELFYMPKTKDGADIRMDFGTLVPQGEITIEILPMDGIINNCGYMMGPPLDDESIGASFQKSDIKRSRRCWAMLAEHKLFVYSMFGLTQSRLQLDLKHCTASFDDEEQLITINSHRNGAEYLFSVPKFQERDRWRMAIECSYDMYINKRDPNSTDRMAAAISLMKRRKKDKDKDKMAKSPSRAIRKSKDRMGRRKVKKVNAMVEESSGKVRAHPNG